MPMIIVHMNSIVNDEEEQQQQMFKVFFLAFFVFLTGRGVDNKDKKRIMVKVNLTTATQKNSRRKWKREDRRPL